MPSAFRLIRPGTHIVMNDGTRRVTIPRHKRERRDAPTCTGRNIDRGDQSITGPDRMKPIGRAGGLLVGAAFPVDVVCADGVAGTASALGE